MADIVIAHKLMGDIVMAHIVIGCIVMAYAVMAYVAMAYVVMAHKVMACIVIAGIVMALIVMAYIVMACLDGSAVLFLKAIVRLGGAVSIVDAMFAHFDAASLHERACRALRHISYGLYSYGSTKEPAVPSGILVMA